MAELQKSDISKILNLIQTEFPRAKEPDIESFKIRRDMWYRVLSVFSKEEVYNAVQEAITTSEFEPKLKTVMDICNRNKKPYTIAPIDLWNAIIDEFPLIGDAVKDMQLGDSRAWNDYTQDFDNESYYSRGTRILEEVFYSLAPETRRYFGNAPERLAALYKMTAESRSYEKARFLKCVQPFIEQQQTATRNGMGDYFEQLTASKTKALPGKQEGDGL